jgi:hypothetical protein
MLRIAVFPLAANTYSGLAFTGNCLKTRRNGMLLTVPLATDFR